MINVVHVHDVMLMSGVSTASKFVSFANYLKSLYKAKSRTPFIHNQWPPPVAEKVLELSMVKVEKIRRGKIKDEHLREAVTGEVDKTLQHKVSVELKDILNTERVLIEGALGCGKSTLSLYICYKWATDQLFTKYKLVILVRLREVKVQNARNVADLLPCQDKAIAQEIAREISINYGKDILFVLDGWDELAVQHGIVHDLIYSSQLHECSIIVTSRPTSSVKLHEVVSSRIEILGFTKDQLQQYFADCLEDATQVELLFQQIKEVPALAGSCYLPLNASIILHLFKCDGELPTTQYGVFSTLICNCILRHLKRGAKHQISSIKSLEELPQIVEGPFQYLCKIAYEGVMEDKLGFDLDQNLDSLGLLHGIETFAASGTTFSYNFLHLSIQELLAANHIATQFEACQQIVHFENFFGNARFNSVLQFYAARTKLQTPGMLEFIIQTVQKCSNSTTSQDTKNLTLCLINCLFEAQEHNMCQLVINHFRSDLNLSDTTLSLADCLSIGYFLAYTKEGFKLKLSGCVLGVEECKTILRPHKKYHFQSLE